MKGKKTGGRVKGSKNRLTLKTRDLIVQFLDAKWPQVAEAFEKLSDREKVHYYERLLQYAIPKYQNVGFELSKFSDQDLETLLNHLKNDEPS